jgi:hypothetical protein
LVGVDAKPFIWSIPMNEKSNERHETLQGSVPQASLTRRSFVKSIAALGTVLSTSSLRSEGLQAQAPATPAPRPVENPPFFSEWGPFTASDQVGRYFQVVYPASTAVGELPLSVTYTLWVPAGVLTIRGVIVHQHGASILAAQAGATAAYDLHWQALAKKWDCALMGPSYRVLNDATDLAPGGAEWWFDPRKGSDKTFLKALNELAAKSGYPEIATVPWCLWGHSGGGIWSNVMSTLHPNRIVAVFLRSGTASMFRHRLEFLQPEVSSAIYSIPTMVNVGVLEMGKVPWDGSIATFKEYRAQGAPIGFAPDPVSGHDCGDSRYLAIPFFDACLAMRLPEKGAKDAALKPVDPSLAWLAPFAGDMALPAAEYKNDPKEAVWLPSVAVAQAWMEYVKTGTVSDATPPPAPFNVRVSTRKDQGNEVTWDAEADFESGIGGFVVLRDGRGVARLPERAPDWVFGRPLFQGLSFHDTPEAPFPRMSYLDSAAPVGVKHTYAIICLNSAGLPSPPSAPVVALRDD